MTNNTFFTVLTAKERYDSDSWTAGRKAEKESLALLDSLYAKAYGKRKKWDIDLAKKIPAILQQQEDWTAFVGSFHKERKEKLDAFEQQLIELAKNTAFPIVQEHVLQETIYNSSYGSQGYGASRYARSAAQNIADKAIQHGLDAFVKAIDDDPEYENLHGWAVWANTTADGWKLLRYKPAVALRDWVRSCWKRGVNPRVYNPFLPVGYEESVGLDFFGGEHNI